MYLNANTNLKQTARKLRNKSTGGERLFWKYVKGKQFLGFSFDRQSIIGNYIADFYCAKAKVIIEIDGDSHIGKEEYDAKRDEYFKSLGLTVIHIDSLDVWYNLDYVFRELEKHPAFKNVQTPRRLTPPPL